MITQRDEDYLICREYQDRIDQKPSEHSDFITFRHPNQNFYFAWINGKDIILRSEAYPDEERMTRGLRAVLRNREFPERYSVEEHHGAHHIILWGGDVHQKHTGNFESHNEIGRSCPRKSREELHNLLLFRGKDFADAVVPLYGNRSTAVPLAAAAGGASDGADRGFRWWWLLPLLLIPLFFMFKSCNKKDLDAQAPSNVSPSTDAETRPPSAEPETKAATPAQPTAPAPVVAPPISTIKEEPPACDLNWIFFDFNKYDIGANASAELRTMAEILKKNGEYTGVLSAYTDSKGSDEYNEKLSRNRANSAKDALIKLGIEAARIRASAFSEATPIATNTEDDTGRKFNRRVELRINDASGHEICRSIPPAVPDTLKP